MEPMGKFCGVALVEYFGVPRASSKESFTGSVKASCNGSVEGSCPGSFVGLLFRVKLTPA